MSERSRGLNVMPSVVALIPARGGSKRVPGKNVRTLGAHPMIAYTIAAATDSGIFDAIVVSTDSEDVAAIARHYGAEVPFLRPAEFATDTSPDIEWLEHAIEGLRARGRTWDCFCLLRPTSPFRTAETIRRAWARFTAQQGVDSLRAVEKCAQHPGKMWIVRGDRMVPLLPFALTRPGATGEPQDQPWHSTPYQALPPVYVQNASLEIAWTRVVRERRTIAGDVLVPFLTDGYEGFDINDACDWMVAERLLADGTVTLPPVARDAFVVART
ncbi:MAG TPA: acylneuraminate cytidylyltransferase family protein [Vicinamibacterales bacterium]|nr:acylneuraminate cytidylyltransferase family protein [Vicinamibacterales bacterium]